MYIYSPASFQETKFISSLTGLLTEDAISLFHEGEGELSRVNFDGVITLTGKIGTQTVGVIVSDFRVGGASFSKKNSKRACAFIQQMKVSKIPLIFVINSLGVRFMEGRTVFDDSFSIIHELYSFKKENLLICVGLGKALGISALFFSQGHYRIALENETQLNLTGPEVHKKFFGKVDAEFSEFTVADHQFLVNSLIHEILPTPAMICRSVHDIIKFVFDGGGHSAPTIPKNFTTETELGGMFLRSAENDKLSELESQLGDSVMELFPQRSPIARVYIGKFGGKKVGYLMSPPGHPNNMLTVKAIDKCLAAMDLFKTLKIPVVSLLDCPGGDPRKAESDKDAIMKMIELTHVMIDYPFQKMGIITGRCFGGSAMFGFPKIYGGKKVLAVKGAQMGVMHRDIIDDLLSGAPRLKEAWLKVSASEVSSLEDLVASGTIDRVIDKSQIRAEIQKFVFLADILGSSPNAETVSNQDETEIRGAINE